MVNYIKENCKLPPLNRPEFDEDTETWDLHFTEKESPDPYNVGGDDIICLAFETLEEANETLKQATLNRPKDIHMQSGSKNGIHTEHLGHILSEMQFLPRAYPDAKW